MGESYIQLPPNSTGLKSHTWRRTVGANDVEDEVVLLGEQPLASYVVPPTNAVTTTLNSHLMQLMAGASLKVRVRRIEVWQNQLANTAALANLSLLRLTSAGTGGTSQTPVPLDPSDAACGATFQTCPTAKGTEGVLLGYASPALIQTVGASTFTMGPIAVWDFDRARSKPLVIAAGAANGIAVKAGTGIAGASVVFNVWFDESSY